MADDARIPWSSVLVGETIGSGASGMVCRGEFASTPVAVKILHSKQVNDTALQQLAQECQLMLQLRHPNVLMTIGFASDGESRHGIIIELMQSGSLRDLLDSATSLSWRHPLLGIARGAAQGMAYLHDRKVVHRDLKPANVMLGPPPHYRPKVADFGESRRYTGDVTMTVTGTPSFVAPEVLRQERSGPGSDVWSFGAMLCHMASRRPPYAALATSTPPYLLMQQVAQGELRPSAEVAGLQWPMGLFEIVTRCEEADPDERPSFQTLVAALGDISTSAEPSATTATAAATAAISAAADGGRGWGSVGFE